MENILLSKIQFMFRFRTHNKTNMNVTDLPTTAPKQTAVTERYTPSCQPPGSNASPYISVFTELKT